MSAIKNFLNRHVFHNHDNDTGNGEWFIKDEGDYIIMSGGYLSSSKAIMSKAEALLGRPINYDNSTVTKTQVNTGDGLRCYYAINCTGKADTDNEMARARKALIEDDGRPYYKSRFNLMSLKVKFATKSFRRPLLLSFSWIVSLAVFVISMLPGVSYTAGLILFVFSLLLFILSMTLTFLWSDTFSKDTNSHIKPSLLCLPAKNGFVYILTNYKNHKPAGIVPAKSLMLLEKIKKKWYKSHPEACILMSNTRMIGDRPALSTFITVSSSKINNDVNYDVDEMINAYTNEHSLGHVEDANTSKKHDEELQAVIDDNADLKDEIIKLKESIRSLEYSALADNRMSTDVDRMVSAFFKSKNPSRKAYTKIIRQLTEMEENLMTVSMSAGDLDSDIEDLHKLIKLRSKK